MNHPRVKLTLNNKKNKVTIITKRTFKMFLIILSILLIISSIIIITKVNAIYKNTVTQNFNSYLIVSDKGGVGLVPGVVFFGRMRPGDTSMATIYLNSTFNYPLNVKIRAIGDLKKFFVNNDFALMPYENKSVYLTVIIPKNTSFGRYDGQVEVKLRKALF